MHVCRIKSTLPPLFFTLLSPASTHSRFPHRAIPFHSDPAGKKNERVAQPHSYIRGTSYGPNMSNTRLSGARSLLDLLSRSASLFVRTQNPHSTNIHTAHSGISARSQKLSPCSLATVVSKSTLAQNVVHRQPSTRTQLFSSIAATGPRRAIGGPQPWYRLTTRFSNDSIQRFSIKSSAPRPSFGRQLNTREEHASAQSNVADVEVGDGSDAAETLKKSLAAVPHYAVKNEIKMRITELDSKGNIIKITAGEFLKSDLCQQVIVEDEQ